MVTVSDRSARGEREDRSGPALAAAAEADGAEVVRRELVPDDPDALAALLAAMCDAPDAPDLVLTTGGTGLGPRDRTPEATAAVCERLVPGIPEALRADSLRVTPHGMLSRGVAGVRGRTLVVNLPGSTGRRPRRLGGRRADRRARGLAAARRGPPGPLTPGVAHGAPH